MMLKWCLFFHVVGILLPSVIAAANDGVASDSISIVQNYDGSNVEEPESSSLSEESGAIDSAAYMRDLRNAMNGKGAMNPNKSYTVQASLPSGELLVLSTPSGCSLLNDAEDSVAGEVANLEFSFRLADLEDCGKVTEGIIKGLQSEIAAEWSNIGSSSDSGSVASSTRLQEIGMRNTNARSEKNDDDDDTQANMGVDDLAGAFLAANLQINLIPTTAEGVFVMHFDITGNTTAEEITQMMANIDSEKLKEVSEAIKSASDKIMNATPEDMAKMEEDFKSFLEKSKAQLTKDIENGKSILEELSNDGISTTDCSSLALDKCDTVSKCGVVKLNGKEKCMVSPKTVLLLMETNCGLQSKAGLLSIVRDLVHAGLMNDAKHQTLRQSFDLGQICNSIVHTYLSADIAETSQHEAKRGFDL
ncbi:hypothetical protein BgAZ_200930 [Babesia gibsoni]|uniref:Uncharacterized protein n=1 Tax=Babesia gibsoni TaxID=33632 RepID=A0AAD8LRK1_BABGI|nr:hypothetical protein BgAZ_200930 [Babesia gibsoni]